MGRLESKKKSKQFNTRPELHVREGGKAEPLPFNLVNVRLLTRTLLPHKRCTDCPCLS